MSEYEQISNLLVRYATGIDSRDWNLFRTCFTEHSQLDYGALGTWDSREAVTRYMEASHSGPSLHRLGNFAITINGDQAKARSYVDVLVHGSGGWGGMNAIGYYDDELIQTAAGWQIARRRFTSVRMRFLGVLGIIPPSIAERLAASASRRFRSAAVAESKQT